LDAAGKSAMSVADGMKSKCLPTDKKCKKKEEEEAARIALAKAKAEEGIYKPEELKVEVKGSGLVCSMDGFVKMVKEMAEVALMALALVKETAMSVIPPEFGKAVGFAWNGMVGLFNPLGYLLAAAYYFGIDFGYGDQLCEAFGYGYYITDALHAIVDFAPKTDQPNIANTASAAAKSDAAKDALKAAGLG